MPETWDPETMTLEVVAATEAPVARSDARGRYAEVLDMATLDLAALAGLPVLDSHRTGSVRDQVGVVESARIDGGQLLATLRLSRADDVRPVVQRVADGTLRGVSIGYRATAWRESTGADGTRTRRPAAWSISEVTLTPQPADPNARIRKQEDNDMPDDLRTTPTPQEAEATRRTEIRALVRSAGLGAEIADQLIDAGADLTRAKSRVVRPRVRPPAPWRPSWPPVAPRTMTRPRLDRRQAEAVAVRMAGGTPSAEA